MQVDAMKLIAAAFDACRDGLASRAAWLTAARAALERSEESGKMRVAVDVSPDSHLSSLLSGPPGRRSDGPWTHDERALLALIRAGLEQCEILLTARRAKSHIFPATPEAFYVPRSAHHPVLRSRQSSAPTDCRRGHHR